MSFPMLSMKSLFPLLVSVSVLMAGCQVEKDSEKTDSEQAQTQGVPSGYESAEAQASYGIGFNVGTNLANEPGVEFQMEAVVQGLKDAMQKKDAAIGPETIQAAMAQLQAQAQAAAAAVQQQASEQAQQFLMDNQAREGVVVTQSGLQYEVLSSSNSGRKPSASDTVSTHYHGTLIDGTVFDSSVDRGEPVEFPVGMVIPGWTEALQLMDVGDKWKLYIPPELGYGERSAGTIPPNSVLVFEVELLDIVASSATTEDANAQSDNTADAAQTEAAGE